MQGRIQDFVKEGGGCTLHGQNVIRETQQYDNNPKITIIILTIFYIIILTLHAKKKVSGRQSVAIGLLFLHPFGGLKWGAHPPPPHPRSATVVLGLLLRVVIIMLFHWSGQSNLACWVAQNPAKFTYSLINSYANDERNVLTKQQQTKRHHRLAVRHR